MAEVMRHCTNFSLNRVEDIQDGDLEQTLVLIVLNYHLPSFTPALWQQVRLRVCADGGANRLFDELPSFLPHEDKESVRHRRAALEIKDLEQQSRKNIRTLLSLRFKPDVIIGDLDSLRPEVKKFYSNLGTTVIDQSYDQDTTDLEKCINFVKNSAPDLEAVKLKVLIMGALGGRFDHVAAHINVLYKFSTMRIILLSDESLVYLLPRGYCHEISLNTTFEGPHCGLIPFGTPSESTTTTGLQWNLSGTKMAFSSLLLESHESFSRIWSPFHFWVWNSRICSRGNLPIMGPGLAGGFHDLTDLGARGLATVEQDIIAHRCYFNDLGATHFWTRNK